MSFPIPPGTRDVLPDEMRELRAVTEACARRSSGAGYGEVRTPDGRVRGRAARGRRERRRRGVAAVRRPRPPAGAALGHDDPDRAAGGHPLRRRTSAPLRLCYVGQAYRSVSRGSGQLREFLQAGVELIGVPGAEGDAEVVALRAEGARGGRACGATGRASATGAVPRAARSVRGAGGAGATALMGSLMRRDLAGLEARVRERRRCRDALFEMPVAARRTGGARPREDAMGEVGATAVLRDARPVRGALAARRRPTA